LLTQEKNPGFSGVGNPQIISGNILNLLSPENVSENDNKFFEHFPGLENSRFFPV
jgi:hypothetical protein